MILSCSNTGSDEHMVSLKLSEKAVVDEIVEMKKIEKVRIKLALKKDDPHNKFSSLKS